ncbi:MAG: hypothetical protein WBP72_13460 [Rhodocyclaceae bacterium]
MTPGEVIERAELDGVVLSLSTAGTVKAQGDSSSLARWAPTLRAHKPAITAALIRAKAETDKIMEWLASIGEHDAEQIAYVMDSCRSDPKARAYFIRRAEGFDE